MALQILSRIGRSPRLLILGFLSVTALLSMWVSNTASTGIMFPIALAILDHASSQGYDTKKGFGTALMLGLAYCASIGGVGIPIGTPLMRSFWELWVNSFRIHPALDFLTGWCLAYPQP